MNMNKNDRDDEQCIHELKIKTMYSIFKMMKKKMHLMMHSRWCIKNIVTMQLKTHDCGCSCSTYEWWNSRQKNYKHLRQCKQYI
jgi:hypothetical protein